MCSLKYEERGKFGKNYRCVRVAQGETENNSSFVSLELMHDGGMLIVGF